MISPEKPNQENSYSAATTPFRILPSPNDLVNLNNTHTFLAAVYQNIPVVGFSYVADGAAPEISFIADCSDNSFASLFQQLIHAYYPNALFEPAPPLITGSGSDRRLEPPAHNAYGATEFYLAFKSEHYLIAVFTGLQPDPHTQLFRVFESLRPDERLAFSTDFIPMDDPKDLLSTRPSWWSSKTARYAVVQIKLEIFTPTQPRLRELTTAIDRFLQIYSAPIPTGQISFHRAKTTTSFLGKVSKAEDEYSPLTFPELAGLVHFPHSSIQSPILLQADTHPKLPAPDFVKEPQGLVFGTNEHRGETSVVRLPSDKRSRHTYICGASGSGKSTLLSNLIKQDLEAGAGFVLLDPHGDLVEDIMPFIPEHRVEDVVYFDPR